ncbi:MAG: HsdR family type I site-specific deoxyribonuclease [Treponema sp.]|nr:HsdR family type I site-specific deoxyribonuclease [Treponema sp.]
MAFNEKQLELSIMELFENEGYTHQTGAEIHREKTEVLLPYLLKAYLLQRYALEYLTESEVSSIVTMLKNISGSDYDANKTVLDLICNGFTIRREDKTKKDLFIELIDFENPENNFFEIVNQVEIQGREQLRIPDGIVYVNGLPLVVLEFKTAIKENTTIENAYKQLTVCYRRDIPELFKYNAFIVISDGVNNKIGSLFSPYEFFYAWRKVESTDKESDGISSLMTMIAGLFRKDRLVSVVKDFIYFPDSTDKETKIVCRYPQYFAATKLFKSIQSAMKPQGDGKGGIYFGATGCGKSYTMVFLSRLLMRSKSFNSPTIVVITDRTDLDDQLSKLFLESKTYIGDENIKCIEARDDENKIGLKQELEGRQSGGVFLTTIQKFCEDIKLLSDRANIICISDEAHRSQTNLEEKIVFTDKGVEHKFGFAKFLHDSLPNATYVGFTGTPLDDMTPVFGQIVDKYTMKESVADGITVNLVYEGRAAKVILDTKKLQEIEKYYAQCEEEGANENQVAASKKAVVNLEAILKDPEIINEVAKDFVEHYETRVREGATVEGKAMFVCSSRETAYMLWQEIIKLRPQWNEKKICTEGATLTEKDKKELKPIEMVKMVMTENKAKGTKGLFELLGNHDYRKELDRQFKNKKSNFKIAIVVDMWITGFDVPCLDTIYIYKPLQKHTLIQTISRVNRTYKNKEKGLIVDYIGIKKAMNKALKKYTGDESEEFEETDKAVAIVKDQISVLDAMFHNFDAGDYYNGTPLKQLECLNKAVEFIQNTEDLEKRFMEAVRRLKKSFNLCSSSDGISKSEKDKIGFYVAVRSVLFKLTKGEAPDITTMNRHVAQMIDEAIKADGVEELFQAGRNVNFEIFTPEYLEKINSIPLPNTKIKILQQLLQQVINEYKKTNKIKAVEFSERMKKLVEAYNNRHYDDFSVQVLDEVTKQLNDLFNDIQKDKDKFKELGISFEEKAFYDILVSCAKKFHFENQYSDEQMKELAKKVKALVDDKTRYTDWDQRIDVKAEMEADLMILLDENGYPPVPRNEVYNEVFEQAENFKKYSE